MSAPLSEQQLAEIRVRLDWARSVAAEATWADGEYESVRAALGDVPALLAEVERLCARVADMEIEFAKLRRWHAEDARQIKAWGRRVAQTQQQVNAARIAGLLEAAEIVGNDDDCGCGGCDTCIPRALAAAVRDRAYALAAATGGAA